MRKDMHKVIVERPRYGGIYDFSKRNRSKEWVRKSIATEVDHYFNPPEQRLEDIFICCDDCTGEPWLLPLGIHEKETPSSMEKMRPVGRGRGRKTFNDNLMPLWRYLRSQVGRSWDSVYSDIRKRISTKSTVQMHVIQHLDWQVEKNTYLDEDGRVYANNRWGTSKCLSDPSPYKFGFYVHPETRVLCETPIKAKREKKKAPTKFDASYLTQYRLIDGVWYLVTLERIPRKLGVPVPYSSSNKFFAGMYVSTLNYEKVGDILFPNGLSNWKREQEYGFADLQAVSIRLLGKREQKDLESLLEEAEKKAKK